MRFCDSIFRQDLPKPTCQTFWHLLMAPGHLSCLQSHPDAPEILGAGLGGVLGARGEQREATFAEWRGAGERERERPFISSSEDHSLIVSTPGYQLGACPCCCQPLRRSYPMSERANEGKKASVDCFPDYFGGMEDGFWGNK